MTILRSGSTEKYAQNWAAAFGEKQAKRKESTAKGRSGARAKQKTGTPKKAKKATSS